MSIGGAKLLLSPSQNPEGIKGKPTSIASRVIPWLPLAEDFGEPPKSTGRRPVLPLNRGFAASCLSVFIRG